MKIEAPPGDGYRLGFTSDQHLGNHRRFGGPLSAGVNRRCSECLDVLSTAVLRARNVHKCRTHIGCGDLFDSTKPPPQIVAAAQKAVKRLSTILMVGNHEQNTTADGDHSDGPMTPVATVIETATVIEYESVVDVLAVPFTTGAPASEWLPATLAQLDKESDADRRVLALHMGIADDDTPPWLTRGHNWIHIDQLEQLAKKYRIDFTIAGDWHEHRRWDRGGRTFVQCGALIPTGFDNPGVMPYGSLYLFDGETGIATREIIPGPRFVKGSSFDTVEAPDDDSHLYVEVTCLPDRRQAEEEKLAYWRQHEMLVDGEVKLDKEEIELDAREAARCARSADTLAETTSEFVAHMPIPEGVDRARVQARIQRYLA